ncbi:MAG: hypothetical protein QOI91_775 [Solirubrobacteraceae bacterium]|jgi:hypothetical protein|nr:hypothetical protein [Solirubrobacteraceae bacterium]
MLREEAQGEADRRNREDPDRARYEFYPFDESAGMSADAWDVAARLRQGPSTDRPATAAAAAGRHAPPAYEDATAVYEEAPVAYDETAVYSEPPPARYAEPEPEPEADDHHDDNRPGFFVRAVGAVVMLVGLVWIVLVVALAVLLKPEGTTSYIVYALAGSLGLLAIGLGVAIRRS